MRRGHRGDCQSERRAASRNVSGQVEGLGLSPRRTPYRSSLGVTSATPEKMGRERCANIVQDSGAVMPNATREGKPKGMPRQFRGSMLAKQRVDGLAVAINGTMAVNPQRQSAEEVVTVRDHPEVPSRSGALTARACRS